MSTRRCKWRRTFGHSSSSDAIRPSRELINNLDTYLGQKIVLAGYAAIASRSFRPRGFHAPPSHWIAGDTMDTTHGQLRSHERQSERSSIVPDRRVSALPVMTEGERAQVVEEWNRTGVSYPAGQCIHEIVEAQAARTPEAVAVVCGGEQVTYGALERRANQVAHVLRAQGVGPEVRVGLLVERSVEMVVGLLGILKAGGAYVPLDPEYPAERLRFMLADSGAAVVLTQESLRAQVPSGYAGPVIAVDACVREGAVRPGLPSTPLPAAGGATAHNLAYIIYTSGSTGTPKGVMVTHENVVRLFAATSREFSFGDGDVLTVFHSLAFDFSVWELWGALLSGARAVIISSALSRSPEMFAKLLRTESVTVLNQTPSAFRGLAAVLLAAGPEHWPALRAVVFGGERLDVTELAPWFARCGDAFPKLINMYGITETTVHVTYRPLATPDARGGSVIGWPLPDLQAYVLDSWGGQVTPGLPGELYGGGAGLARGYLNRASLTADRFVPNPFGAEPGARLYRTGDRVRRRPSGELEFLGRLDHQVKLRGYRIELGEVEHALTQHPAVAQAVALVREDVPGDARLVAYVVPPADLALDVPALRTALGAWLPSYMVPSAVVVLDALPLTTHGKVDRRALPAPEGERPDLGTTYAAPRTPAEEVVAGIWAEVLGLDRVGIHDNFFFDLGGHSLLATRVVAQTRTALRLELPVRVLFDAPTVARFTQALATLG